MYEIPILIIIEEIAEKDGQSKLPRHGLDYSVLYFSATLEISQAKVRVLKISQPSSVRTKNNNNRPDHKIVNKK